MQDKLNYFVTIADEKNITRAAKKLFVSQQCLSAYIKDLEEEYGTKLFYRKPQFGLTKAGEIFYNAAKQMQVLQNDARQRIKSAEYDYKGELSIGVHPSRGDAFLPDVLEMLWKEFPNVKVLVRDGTTIDFEEKLQEGHIDMYVGCNPRFGRGVEKILLLDEEVMICISESLIRKYFFNNYPKCLEWVEKGIHIDWFRDVPFIFNYSKSNVYLSVQAYLAENGIIMNERLGSNSAAIRIEMAARGFGACIINTMRIPYIAKRNQELPPERKLFLFPITDCIQPSRMYLVYRSALYRPVFMQRFQQIIVDYFKTRYAQN